MRIVTLLAFVLLALAAASFSQAPENPCGEDHGAFSCQARDIMGHVRAPLILPSPDGKKRIVAKQETKKWWTSKVSVVVGGKHFSTGIGDDLNAEVLWAPDSAAFAETYSQGGAVGHYVVFVHYVTENGFRVLGPGAEADPTKQVVKDFMSYPISCGGPREEPNLGAVGWGKDSKTLYIAAEILPHSYCDCMGTFRLYKVSLPDGSILGSWSQLQAKRYFWSSLGIELRNADDDCIRDPASCYVPYNHPECFPADERARAKMPFYCSKVLKTAN